MNKTNDILGFDPMVLWFPTLHPLNSPRGHAACVCVGIGLVARSLGRVVEIVGQESGDEFQITVLHESITFSAHLAHAIAARGLSDLLQADVNVGDITARYGSPILTCPEGLDELNAARLSNVAASMGGLLVALAEQLTKDCFLRLDPVPVREDRAAEVVAKLDQLVAVLERPVIETSVVNRDASDLITSVTKTTESMNPVT